MHVHVIDNVIVLNNGICKVLLNDRETLRKDS